MRAKSRISSSVEGELLALLVAVAFFAGFISSMAGAGGLLTLPLLLWAGLPPLAALATNKVQSAMGTLSSSWNFFRRGHIHFAAIAWLLPAVLLGSVVGTLAVQRLDGSQLAQLLPLLLIGIALYFLVKPALSESRAARLSPKVFALAAGLPMGFYGGFFGPASGSILPFLLVSLAGRNLVRATAETKILILTINGSSALLFIVAGQVNWTLALAMGSAQIIGARLGSNMVIKRGAAWVQPLIVAVTLLVAIHLLVTA
ncbi:MAG: TSUP family transporter [Porticoccaceae bacterium]